MTLAKLFLNELESEAKNTKKILERIPIEYFDWKPHEKSFSLGKLATHLTELPSWIGITVNADELDFAILKYTPLDVTNSAELMHSFEDHIAKAKEVLQKNVSDEDLMKSWTLKNGVHVFFTLPKVTVLRSMVFSHIVHHRAQLGVYLRLLDIPVPGIYGPTADEVA